MLMGREAELAWCAQAFSRRRVVAICGLPGIGKTSLLLSAAHDQARRVAGTVAYHAAADGERIGDVLTSLLATAQIGAMAGSLRAALDQLVVQSQRAPVVLCIDDIHRISDPMLLDVLAHLATSSSSLWIATVSRRQLPLPDSDIDGAVLRLGPLSTDSARALWADLEERFGPSVARFDALDAARRGSPFALRRAFAQDLPPQVAERGKTGFGVPLGRWFREDLRELARDVLSTDRGWFRADTVSRLLDEHESRRADHGHRLWCLLMLELWVREHVEAPVLVAA